MKCWEQRGCEGKMAFDCPHDAAGLCPRTCINTICSNSWHVRASGMEMLEAYDVDFSVARKENCHNCKFFLEHAPRVSS